MDHEKPEDRVRQKDPKKPESHLKPEDYEKPVHLAKPEHDMIAEYRLKLEDHEKPGTTHHMELENSAAGFSLSEPTQPRCARITRAYSAHTTISIP